MRAKQRRRLRRQLAFLLVTYPLFVWCLLLWMVLLLNVLLTPRSPVQYPWEPFFFVMPGYFVALITGSMSLAYLRPKLAKRLRLMPIRLRVELRKINERKKRRWGTIYLVGTFALLVMTTILCLQVCCGRFVL